LPPGLGLEGDTYNNRNTTGTMTSTEAITAYGHYSASGLAPIVGGGVTSFGTQDEAQNVGPNEEGDGPREPMGAAAAQDIISGESYVEIPRQSSNLFVNDFDFSNNSSAAASRLGDLLGTIGKLRPGDIGFEVNGHGQVRLTFSANARDLIRKALALPGLDAGMRGLLEAALGTGAAKWMRPGPMGFEVGDGAGIGNPALGAQYFPWGPAGVFGRPGMAESLIPLWGSIRSLLNDLYEGRLGWAAADGLFVGLDLTLAGKLLTEPLKLGIRDFLRSEAAAATEEGAKAVGGKGVQAGAAELGKAADAGEKAAQEAARAAEMAGKPKPKVNISAYETAANGGKHSGFLRNYLGESPEELRRGIASLQKQIAEHRDKIANPEKYIPNFKQLDPRQQAALLGKKWPSDIHRLQEQLEMLQELLRRITGG
jgi:hypothetical protein